MSAVGRSIPHESAGLHVTGAARYVDDTPPVPGELFVGVVASPVAHGRLLGLNADALRALPGVVDVLVAADLPGRTHWGPIFHDEPFLPAEVVEYAGQPVAIVAATSPSALHAALRAAEVAVDALTPILTVEDAIAADSWLGPARFIRRGDPEAALAAAPHRLAGTLWINGQEQLYLESQSARAVPGEDGAVSVLSSSQNPTEVQQVVAELLDLPFHKVTAECRRMGGGFGGKETQAAMPAAFAAWIAARNGVPARFVYTRDEDARSTGKRHPFLVRWQVGFDDDGRIDALDVELHSNGGAYADLSTSIFERAMLHAENAYFIPNFCAHGRPCRTHLPPNTAFRGFGGPQGVAQIEHVIEAIARHLGKDALEIRRINLYGRGARDTTPYGQVVANHILPELLDRLAAKGDYAARRAEIDASDPTMALRGLALTPVKFGISFTTRHLNQASALVNIYKDGSVQVTTGGTEMGQGLFTKIRQLVADALGVTLDAVRVMGTSTDRNNNASPTAASAGTDLNGMAALDACRQLREGLNEVAAKALADPAAGRPASPEHVVINDGVVSDARAPHVQLPFARLCILAWLDRVSLGARGFYRTPGVDFNRETGQGTPFFYYTCGAALSEVAIDRFTGALRVVRSDLVMDLGAPINPAIDEGQVIGAFVQGMGWVTAEELRYDAGGRLLSLSPTTYKIPGVRDVPALTCELVPNPGHTINVAKSKAVGEPPLMLAISVWAAVQDALRRIGPAPTGLHLPATAEEILRRIAELEGAGFGGDGQEIPLVGR